MKTSKHYPRQNTPALCEAYELYNKKKMENLYPYQQGAF